MSRQLGQNIRQRRKELGLTLDALSERSGVSRAMISEIERSCKNPTINVLVQIANGLGCTVSTLIEEAFAGSNGRPAQLGAGVAAGSGSRKPVLMRHELGEPGTAGNGNPRGQPSVAAINAGLSVVSLTRRDERRVLVDSGSGAQRYALSPVLARRGVDVLWYELPPRADLGVFAPRKGGTHIHVTVLEGRLLCRVGEREMTLGVGDSLSFAADEPHAFRNPGDVTSCFFVVVDTHTE